MIDQTPQRKKKGVEPTWDLKFEEGCVFLFQFAWCYGQLTLVVFLCCKVLVFLGAI